MRLRLLIFLFSSAIPCFAEPQPLMTTAGKSVVSEDFAGPALPPTWYPKGAPDSFSVAEGALRCVCKPSGAHSPFVIVRLPAHDVTVKFSAKFDQRGVMLLMIDGYNEMFKGNTHLVQLKIKPSEASLLQDRGSPESKQSVKKENAAARKDGGKLPPPTAEQLKDPRYYRSEELATKTVNLNLGQWHDVLLEISGNDLVAQIDDHVMLAKASVADAAKSRMGFEIAGNTTVWIRNVRVWENTRRGDWDQVKEKLAAAPGAKSDDPKK